jgi:hypothetical protein
MPQILTRFARKPFNKDFCKYNQGLWRKEEKKGLSKCYLLYRDTSILKIVFLGDGTLILPH